MRVLSDINHIDLAQWQHLVAISPTATWFQTKDAYDFYASNPAEMTPFVFAVTDQDHLHGIIVGYVTKDTSPFRNFFTRRAIINGGPLLAENIADDELTALLLALRQSLHRKAIYIETRNFHSFHRHKSVFEACGFAYQKHLNFHIDTSDKDLMWSRITEAKRRQIRKAQALGVTIAEPDSVEDVRAFYHILHRLYRRRVKRPLFTETFFVHFYEQRLGRYLLVKYKNQVIGGVMCAVLSDACIYEWYICGEDGIHRDLFPSVMATWAVMDYAATHGIKCFDVMGAGVPEVPYGVRDFKADFGGELVEHGRFIHIPHPLLYRLGKAGVNFLNRR